MNTASRHSPGWDDPRVAHSECSSLHQFRSRQPLLLEQLHRLLIYADLHTEDQVREAVVRPAEQRDQFLVWYDLWKAVSGYRENEDRQWVAPNQHFSDDPALKRIADDRLAERKAEK